MNSNDNGSSAASSVPVTAPEYAMLRAQPSGFQFAGTLVTRFFPTVALAIEAR